MNPIKIKTLVTSQEEGAPTNYEGRGVKKKINKSISDLLLSFMMISHTSFF